MRSCGSIQFRDVDRPALLREIEKLASRRQIKFLIGPELDGWTAVYPAPNGQDGTIAAALAKALNASALHLLVHEDAFLALSLYHGAEWIYGYNSNPHYFDEIWPPTKSRYHGNITSLFQLVDPKVSPTAVRVLIFRLNQKDGAGAVSAEQLSEIAQSLGIQNAATSYARLFAGDREAIASWENFDHVPDL